MGVRKGGHSPDEIGQKERLRKSIWVKRCINVDSAGTRGKVGSLNPCARPSGGKKRGMIVSLRFVMRKKEG